MLWEIESGHRGAGQGLFMGCPSSWRDDNCTEKDVKWGNWGEELSRPRERQVQGPWGRDTWVVFKKRSPGWTELGEEDSSVKWDQRLYMSTGVHQALEATGGSLAFSPPFMENHGMQKLGQWCAWSDFFKELFSYCVEVGSTEVTWEAGVWVQEGWWWFGHSSGRRWMRDVFWRKDIQTLHSFKNRLTWELPCHPCSTGWLLKSTWI